MVDKINHEKDLEVECDGSRQLNIYYGEKLIVGKRSQSEKNRIICDHRKLLVVGRSKYTLITLENGQQLIIWGNIYAYVQNDGKLLPISMRNSEDRMRLAHWFFNQDLSAVISRLEGFYVACLVKSEDEAIIFADTYNRRDLFYTITDSGIAISSDLYGVIGDGPKKYDQAALVNMLTIFGGYAPKKHTIYKDVRRLGVGERLELRHGQCEIKRSSFTPLNIMDYGEKELEKHAELLEEAIKIRASQSCNWVYLTGGWDSSAILAILVKHFGSQRVRALSGKILFSKDRPDPNCFEVERGRRIAEYYNVEFETVPWDLTTEYAVECWQKTVPFFRKNHVYAKNANDYIFLSEHLGQRAFADDAIFTGEICDGSYAFGCACSRTIQEHPDLSFRAYADKMAAYLFGPTFFETVLNGSCENDAVFKLLRSRAAGSKFDNLSKMTPEARRTAVIAACFIRGRRIPFYSRNNESTLTKAGAALYEDEMVDQYLADCIANVTPDNLYSWLLHLYNSFHWQGSTIKSMTTSGLYNNLNVHLPFWDSRLISFLSQMPENWGRGLDFRPIKYPLKWMLQNRIDYPLHLQKNARSFINDVDPSVSFDAELLYSTALAPHFKKMIAGYPFMEVLDERYFNLAYYRRLADEYVAGAKVGGQELADLNKLILFCWVGWY